MIEAVSALVGDVGRGHRLELLGRLRRPHRERACRCSPTTRTSAPRCRASGTRSGCSCATVDGELPVRCRRASASPGVPGVVIGHNDRIAWGFTNLTTDVTDLYLEKVEGDQYWRDGALVPLDERTETIKVAGGDDVELDDPLDRARPDPVRTDRRLRRDRRRPVHRHADGAVADAGRPHRRASTRSACSGPRCSRARPRHAIFALNVAQDFDDFRAAAALFDVPAQNLIYADVDGNIGYQTPGQLPIRGAGDGSMPQPGWDSAYDWQGFIPFEELPTSYNPPEGYIVTANNAIVGRDYPYFLTRDWDYGWRAARIVDLLQRKAAVGSSPPTTCATSRPTTSSGWASDSPRRTSTSRRDAGDRMPRSTCCARGTRRTPPTRLPPRTRTCCGTNSSLDLFVTRS